MLKFKGGQTRFQPRALQLENASNLVFAFLQLLPVRHALQVRVQIAALTSGRCGPVLSNAFQKGNFRGVNSVSEVATVLTKYCGNAHWRYFAFLAHELTIDFFCFSVRVTDGSPRGQRVRRYELSGGVFNLSNLSPPASRTPTLIVLSGGDTPS